MDLQLANKKVLITGGSKGLGFGTACALAQEGCDLIIASRNADNLHHAAESIFSETANKVRTFSADVSKKYEVDNLMSFVESTFGKLDILVSNSGGPNAGKFDAIPDDWWYAAMDNNLMSTVWLFRHGIRLMRNNKSGGRLLVITTTGAKQPQDNLLLSNVFRAGVHAFVKTLSREVADLGITVNAIVPGKFMTDRQMSAVNALSKRTNISTEEAIAKRLENVPIGRMGDPLELGRYISFLSSPIANYISGTALNIDGGYLASI